MTAHNGRHTRQTRISMPAISFTVWARIARLPPTPNVSALPFRQIRGQTGVVPASPFSQKLRCAISGESYISPSWQGRHCYGATFVLNSNDETWYPNEEIDNRAALQQLNPPLAQSLFEQDSFSDGLYWPQGVWLNPPHCRACLIESSAD